VWDNAAKLIFQKSSIPARIRQVRIVALCEVGSHVFFNFLAKPIRCGEATMAQHVYKGLPEKSLLLFDIGFCSFKLREHRIELNYITQYMIVIGKNDPSENGSAMLLKEFI